jgi:hypothetical protein
MLYLQRFYASLSKASRPGNRQEPSLMPPRQTSTLKSSKTSDDLKRPCPMLAKYCPQHCSDHPGRSHLSSSLLRPSHVSAFSRFAHITTQLNAQATWRSAAYLSASAIAECPSAKLRYLTHAVPRITSCRCREATMDMGLPQLRGGSHFVVSEVGLGH